MSENEKPKGRGGAGRGQGRKKQERPVDGNVARKIKAKIGAEKLWVALVKLECNRLGIDDEGNLSKAPKGAIEGPDYQGKFSIIPLTNLLRYLDDRDLGRPMDTVNHLHDKPIEMNVKVSIAEVVRKVRERKEEYERSR